MTAVYPEILPEMLNSIIIRRLIVDLLA